MRLGRNRLWLNVQESRSCTSSIITAIATTNLTQSWTHWRTSCIPAAQRNGLCKRASNKKEQTTPIQSSNHLQKIKRICKTMDKGLTSLLGKIMEQVFKDGTLRTGVWLGTDSTAETICLSNELPSVIKQLILWMLGTAVDVHLHF